jgi:phenylpyruvate tautomerase PptA (4-oxalocrotonate tautomerase family)
MPTIRGVNCPKGAHSSEQKPTLAPPLVQALIRQGIDPVTEIGTAATGFFFNEFDVENWFPGGFRRPSIPTRCSGFSLPNVSSCCRSPVTQ